MIREEGGKRGVIMRGGGREERSDHEGRREGREE